jgi:hypothetical protein
METITYDLIISYLCKENILESTDFKLSKYKYHYINYPKEKNYIDTFILNKENYIENFENIFYNDNFFRYGASLYDDKNTNFSFWTSLLSLVNSDFMSIKEIMYSNELLLINEFKNDLINKYNKTVLSNKIKHINKTEIREILKLNPCIQLLQYIVDILNINIIIFNYTDNKIYTIYCNNFLNFTIDTIIFAKKEDIWQPIMLNIDNNIKKIFNINDNIIIKLNEYKSNILYCDNFREIKFDNIIKYNKTSLNKLKINDINFLIKSLNIDISNIKKTTKAILIDLILNNT